jgi:hypothetical protein
MRLLHSFAVVTLATLGAAPAAAQLGVGAHVVRAADAFGGATGGGVRLTLSAPLVPVSGAVNAEYFFPDCTGDCGLAGITFEANFQLPLPFIKPWGGVGYAIRRHQAGDATTSHTGYTAGAGIEIAISRIRPFLEARYEFVDAPEHQLITRIGLTYR